MTKAVSMLIDVSYPCYSVGPVSTPDGKMTINFIEDHKGKLIDLQIFIGKTGTALAAWVNAVAILIRLALDSNNSIEEILVAISNITTHRVTYTNSGKVPIRSGVDGLAYAIMRYQELKYKEFKQKNEGIDRPIFRKGFN